MARPLDPKGDQDGHESLTSPETLALWELARLQDQPVALRFLDEATRPPVALAQLRSRSEPALIAAIGLDPARREKAASLLRERLHDDKLSTSDKVELATIALELHDQPSETLDECVRTIIEARRIKPEVRLGPDWQAHVSRASRLYEPRAVSRILLAELDRPTISYVRITEDLEPLFDRLSRAELETFRRSLVERVIAKRIELGVEMRSPLLADRLNSAESAAILQSWIEDVKRQEESKKKTPGNPPFPTRVYLWARLDAADSARILEQLLDQCDLDSWLFGNMQQVVVEAFNRLNPVDSERLSTKLMEVLAAKLETKMDEKDLNHINGFLGMIGRGLNLSTPRTGWRPSILALNRAIDRQPKVEDRAKLAWGIGPMADRLGPEEAANVCLPFAEVLRTSLEQNSVGAVDDKAFPLIQSLAAMALRLPPDQAAKLIRLLAIRAADAVPANFQASSNFYFLLAGLSEDDARQAARVIVSALNGEKDSKIRWALGAGLCVVAERMKPAEALEICGPVANQMADSFLLMKEHKFYLVNSLGVVTSRLPESQRREIVQTLLNSLEKTTDFPDFHWVVSAITASIGPGDTIDAARLARIIGPLLARESDSDLRSSYVLELGKLADRAPVLELKTILVTALEQERDPDVRVALANSLITLAGRVPAAELGAVLVALHEREPNAQLRESIIAVILKMTPTDAAALSTRMARGLVRSFEHKETDEQSLQQRLDIIKFTEKMPARESEPLCAGVIARNLKARGMELDDGGGVLTIDASVPTLLAEIRPDSAHVIARELADVFFEDSETFPGNMSETFTIFQSLLTDTSRAERALRPVAPASTTKPPATSAPATTPPYPCRLTTQELVDLLKMPTCFGMVRDLILNQLANRYGRKFASHWEFVRFAREQKLDLDFTTPPRRPDPKASLRRVLDVLDGLQRP